MRRGAGALLILSGAIFFAARAAGDVTGRYVFAQTAMVAFYAWMAMSVVGGLLLMLGDVVEEVWHARPTE